MEELLKAVKVGNLVKIKECVRLGVDLNAKDLDGWTVLHHVAKSGNVKVAKYVIGQGVDVNCKTTGAKGFQETPLLVSCQEGNLDMFKYLLAHGADIKTRDRRGRNVLHFGSESHNPKLVEYLVSQSVDVNCKDTNNSSPLLIACSKGDNNTAKYLIGHGADINTRDRWVGNVLHYACEANSLALVKYLVSQGADVNCKGAYDVTPLLISCEKGNIAIVKCLLGHGADIRSRDKRGRGVLSYGHESNKADLVKYLRSQGAVDGNDEKAKTTNAAPPDLGSDVAVTSITSTTATAIFDAPSSGDYDCFKISILPWTNGETLTSLVNQSGTTYQALLSNLVPGADYTVAVGTVIGGVAGKQRTRKFKTCKPRVQEDKPATNEAPQVGPGTDATASPQPLGPVVIQQIAHVSGTGNIGNIHNEGTFIVNVTNTRTTARKNKKHKTGRRVVPRSGKTRKDGNRNVSRDEPLAGSSSSSGEQLPGEAPIVWNSAKTQHGVVLNEGLPLLQVQLNDVNSPGDDEQPTGEIKLGKWCCCLGPTRTH